MATISFKVSEEEALQIPGRAGSQRQITQISVDGFYQKAIHRNVHPRLFFVQNATLERELSAVVNQS